MKFVKKSPPLAVCAISALLAFAAQAETLTVTSNADSGDGTLRALVGSAADGDVIEIPEGMTIALESQIALPPKISFTIKGCGSGATISGGGKTRVFYYNLDRRQDPVYRHQRFENLTLRDGVAESGGFLKTNGTWQQMAFEFSDCKIIGNRATSGSGGAIGTAGVGDLIFESCDIIGNSATATATATYEGGGGFIGSPGNFNFFSSNLTLTACNVISNTSSGTLPAAVFKGGHSGTLMVEKTLFKGNSATQVSGTGLCAGIYTQCKTTSNCKFKFKECEFAENATTNIGHVLCAVSLGDVRFEKCNIHDNLSTSDLFRFGNNKAHQDIWATIDDCLIETNNAFVFTTIAGAGSSVALRNTLIRGNASPGSYIIGSQSGDGGQVLSLEDSQVIDNTSSHGVFFTGYQVACNGVSFIGNGYCLTDKSQKYGSTVREVSTFTNCTFVGNSIYGRSLFYCAIANTEYNSMTVVSNTCAESGYGVWYEAVSPKIVNCVIVGNSPKNLTHSGTLPTDISHSFIGYSQGSYPDDNNTYDAKADELGFVWPLSSAGSGVKFLNGDGLQVLAISKKSPLKGAASPIAAPTADARGKKRNALAPCIGAYEYIAPGLSLIVR